MPLMPRGANPAVSYVISTPTGLCHLAWGCVSALPWAMLLLTASLQASSYIPWQASFDLWMPQVSTRRSLTNALEEGPRPQPFNRPVMLFAPPPLVTPLDFSPQQAFISQDVAAPAPTAGQGSAPSPTPSVSAGK